MKFKVTKIATAVATGLGLSAMGMGTAHADRIMFPYIGGSSTVATIVSVINQADVPGTPDRLHYQIFHKDGSAASNNAASCSEDSVFRKTSVNDIVTFDLTGHFGDANGVLFEPAATNPKYDDGSFAFLEPVLAALPADQRQVRGWMMVDNLGVGAAGPAVPNTLNGEAFLLDFVEGAAWGYVAYNPAIGADPYDFSDAVESQGEVLAGGMRYDDAALRAGAISHSPRVPVVLYPMPNGDFTQQLIVTPINHAVINTSVPAILPGRSDRAGQAWQNATVLKTRIGLSVLPVGSSLIAFNRDEQQIDGTAGADITCVGTVKVTDLFTSLGQSQLANGGWSAVRVTSPGPLVENIPTAPTPITVANGARRTFNTNEAIVMKLEYNLSGEFLDGAGFKGAYNNGYWMRRGNRESLKIPVQTLANLQPFATGDVPIDVIADRFVIQPNSGETPVDVSNLYPSTSIPASQFQ